MKNTPVITGLLAILFLYGCPFSPKKEYHYKGYFPDSTAFNFTQLNSEYDEINMALLELHSYNFIAFSSNEPSNGEQFDIKGQAFTFVWDQRTGIFRIETEYYSDRSQFADLIESTRTEADEYGPYFVSVKDTGYLFYAGNQSGTNDMLYLQMNNLDDYIYYNANPNTLIENLNGISFLSSELSNEGYVSFRTSKAPYDFLNRVGDSTIFESMVYCDDRDGEYNIYEIEIPDSLELNEFISSDDQYTKTAIGAVNSSNNDRCPNVCGNFMVFSSDRAGGLGGYDFYYSVFENGQWSEPVNLGKPVNSEYDEYRAIAIKSADFENDLLIFSSNRPGGAGGYDIYYTGIDVMPIAKYE
ncbi:MAG: hypothetical protein PF436_10850 [Prolixibacteraceae bacterium]|nr:hypothetical protein [Prolixibacteraceae bacterium]